MKCAQQNFKWLNSWQVKVEAPAWSYNRILGIFNASPASTQLCPNIPKNIKNHKNLMTSLIMLFNERRNCCWEISFGHKVIAQSTIAQKCLNDIFKFWKKSWFTFHFTDFSHSEVHVWNLCYVIDRMIVWQRQGSSIETEASRAEGE